MAVSLLISEWISDWFSANLHVPLSGVLSHHLRMMGGMDLWYPPDDQPHLLEWWRPLLLASRAARVERFPWPLHIDEVQLVGRVDRGSRGAIWVYRHSESRGEIYKIGRAHV